MSLTGWILRRPPPYVSGNPNRVPEGALTAAGFRVQHTNTDQLRRLLQPWQSRAFAYYDQLGEINYASQFYARMLAPLRLFAAKLDEVGDWVEIEREDASGDDLAAIEALDRIQDPGGGRESLLSSYGRLMFLAGECYLLCSTDPETGDEQWEMLSTDELRIQGETYIRYRAPSLAAENLHEADDDDFDELDSDHAVAYRLWQRHPRYCADEKTEILTENGWVSHDGLHPGVRVLTLNHKTGLSEWQPVSAVNRFPVEEEPMVSIEGAAHSSLTTLDHRWPTEHRSTATEEWGRHWTTSERLNSCDRLITGTECSDLPTERTFSDDFVEAVAWFYTEGTIARRHRSEQVSICQSEKANPGYVGRIRDTLTGVFEEPTTERMSTGSGPLAPPLWREYREPNRDHVYFWLNTAASFGLLEVAPAKVVSLDFIRTLTRDQLRLFVETSLAADGYKRLLAQKDARRVAAFEFACILLGLTPHTYSIASEMTMVNARDYGTCSISPRGRDRGMKPTPSVYTGIVWCPTTANGSWMARRNGTVYYTGNSMLADSTMKGVLDLCVAEKSLVSTRRGPVPIEEVEVGDEVFTWTADGLRPNPVVRVCDRGEQEVLKVTAGRRTIRATADHPVLVLRKSKPGRGYSANYDPEWVPVGELRVGDHLVALDRLPDYGTDQVLPDGTAVTEDVAWLLGQIVGDGHVHAEGLNIAVYNEERRGRIASIVGETWGLADHPQGGNARFYSRPLRRMLARVGLRVYSYEKRIPAEILAAPATVKRAFLAGYEEADGHLTKEGWQSLALTSERLARELRGLYIELGENVSNLAIEERAAVIVMPGGYTTENARPLHRFQVYYGSTRRGAKAILQAKDAVEKIGGDHFTLATVKRIEIEGVAATYDLEVRGAHNYLADGVVSHNCEELLLLTRAVRARARSRLAGSGILALSEDFSHSPLEATSDEDPEVDPFLADLRDAMLAPIANEGAASQVVPIVIRGPTAAIRDGIQHVQIVDPTQLYPETGLRTECIHRIALGLDMPPEILEGLQDSNHWTAWQIDDNTWTAHGMPKANQLVNDLTQAFFRPELRSKGIDYKVYAIGYDPAAIVNQPDKLKDALDLYDRIIVGKTYVRDAGGIAEGAAPTDEERAEMVGIKTRDSSLAWFGTPAPRGGAVETGPGEITSDQPGDTSTTPASTTPGSVAEEGPPSEPTGEQLAASGNGRSNGKEALALARIAGAADLAIARIREAAGNRLRSLAKRDRETLALIEGVRPGDVAATLGPDRVRALKVTERELVASAEMIFAETLRMWGVKENTKAKVVLEQIELHAARTLYDLHPSPLPPAFQRYVAGVFEKAA